jgi:hypothetical protein
VVPSSALCRAQEAYQRSRATGAVLANVRMIAEKAATAWNIEALVAEKREQRQDQTRRIGAHLLEEKQESREQHDRLFSENPDRGFAAT